MAQANQLGGGGCPAYDILVEDLPFDFLQPNMVRGLTQAGYGGPFVVRNNPIGAIFDAIRAFCFPAPMQASSDGSQYTDLSGNGLDTFGGYTTQDLGGLSAGTPIGNQATGQCQPPVLGCGSQTWDYQQCMCVPTAGTSPSTPAAGGGGMMIPANVPMCDDPTYQAMVFMMEGQAYANKDIPSLCKAQGDIDACAAASSVPTIKARWVAEQGVVRARLINLGCNDCAKCKGNNTATPPTPPPMGMSPAMNNPMMGNAGKNPAFGYILASPSGGNNAPNPGGSTTPATVTNPPPNMPTGLGRLRFAPLPQIPSPMSLTESTPSFTPFAEPMGGSFDPARIEGGRLSRPRSFSQRMLGMRRGL